MYINCPYYCPYCGYTRYRNDEMLQEPNDESNDTICLIINTDNKKKLPGHFRKTTDLTNLRGNNLANLNGLGNLNISGSGQFSEKGLVLTKQDIGRSMPITIVDLRQESHGFINGIAVCWADDHNKANRGLTREEVLSDENTRLQSIELNKPISIEDKTLVPKKVQSEENLVKSYGMSYIRIPVTDKGLPDNDMTDYFIKFVTSLSSNTWLHFHCKAGKGRTTTLMVMYDIMENAKNVSLIDIVNRQFLLGGRNLLRAEQLTRDRSEQRAKFLNSFYRYCVENNDNFKTTWSQWVQTMGL